MSRRFVFLVCASGFLVPIMGGHKGIAWRERGDYLCGCDRGEGSRFRVDLICCVGIFEYSQNGHMRITAGLRCAPPVGRRLAFGNPLVGHGGCRESGAQPPVPASQVRKPAAVMRNNGLRGACSIGGGGQKQNAVHCPMGASLFGRKRGAKANQA